MIDPVIRIRQAIIDGNLLILKRLLKRYPELLTNIDPTNGWTSLHYAAFHGAYLICVHLLRLGHDKDEVLYTFSGWNALHLSIVGGDEQTVYLLLQSFPKLVNDPTREPSAPGVLPVIQGKALRPLHLCSLLKLPQILQLLLPVADISLLDAQGNTPLHYATSYGSVSCMRTLIHHGINTGLRNKDGWLAVDLCITDHVSDEYLKMIAGKSSSADDNKYSLADDMKNLSVQYASSPVLANGSLTPMSPLVRLPSITTRIHPNVAQLSPISPAPDARDRSQSVTSALSKRSSLSDFFNDRAGLRGAEKKLLLVPVNKIRRHASEGPNK